MRHAIQLDFAGGRRGLSPAGGLLLALGVAAAVAVLLEYRLMGEHRAGLELRVAALIRANTPATSQRDATADARIAAGMGRHLARVADGHSIVTFAVPECVEPGGRGHPLDVEGVLDGHR